ncbi:MAG: hypothetical protein WDM76_02450 [Limisphaerales bacterium]
MGDFFIGAHAMAEKMKLATRDAERIKTYFPHGKNWWCLPKSKTDYEVVCRPAATKEKSRC